MGFALHIIDIREGGTGLCFSSCLSSSHLGQYIISEKVQLLLGVVMYVSGLFIASVCTVTVQHWPFHIFSLYMRRCWANLWEIVAGEQPGYNVCRCIPNRRGAFLVIAISICALICLLSLFRFYLSPVLLFTSSLADAHIWKWTDMVTAFFSLIFPNWIQIYGSLWTNNLANSWNPIPPPAGEHNEINRIHFLLCPVIETN